MKKAILFFSLTLLGFNLSAQEFFSATAATADEAAHLRFMKMNKSEYEKRSAIWKVPSTVVRVIASAQSGAGYLDGYNYGAVLPTAGITKYSKFSKIDDFDLVACSKPSRGIEVIALALNIMNANTGGALQTDEDYLQHVFGAGGELALMASEAEIAYRAFTQKTIYLESGYVAPSQSATYSNSTPVQSMAPSSNNIVTEATPSVTEYSNNVATEVISTSDVPNLMVEDKTVKVVEETVNEIQTETSFISTETSEVTESISTFESMEAVEAAPVASEATESFESSESFETTPMSTEISKERKVENIVIRKQDTTGELDAMGRRIIKDPADNINTIESYENTAAGSKIVREIEVEEVEQPRIVSQEEEEPVRVDEQDATNKKLEVTNKQQEELKMAGQTEAQKRETEILKAEQMIIQQRKEMAERRAKKAAAAEAAKANGGN